MTTHPGIRFLALVLLVSVQSTAAVAQTLPPPSAAGRQIAALDPGARVRVTNAEDDRLDGTIVSSSTTGLVLRVKGRRLSLPIESIRRVEKRPQGGRWGAVIGASITGVSMCASFQQHSRHVWDCGASDREWGSGLPFLALIGAGIGAGFGGAVGAAADVLRGDRQLVFASEAVMPAGSTKTDVWVTTADGVEHKGRGASFSPYSVTLDASGATTSIPMGEITRIDVRDSIDDGAAKGALVGALGMAAFGISRGSDCDSCGAFQLLGATWSGLLGAGAGLAVGAAIDAAVRARRPLYATTSARPSRVSTSVVPILAPRYVGLSVTMQW